MAGDRIEEIIEEIRGLLEEGESQKAASRALAALSEAGEQPEFRYLLGVSLLDLDEPEAAITELERAAELDPEWPDPHNGLAWARFRTCRFDEAAASAAKAIELDPKLPDSHQLLGLLAERRGDEAAAITSFAEARRLDPDLYPEPYEMSEDEFLEVAQEAVAELPPEILAVLEETALFVQDVPTEELLRDADPPLDPQLLGLFVGMSLLEQSTQDSGSMPNTMYLFQKNLERMATTREELDDEIRITALHEIGHHLGWGEEELAARGLA